MIIQGEYPNTWKIEMVTPVPKIYPPLKKTDLRKISGLKNFSKITEKIIATWMLSDMEKSSDMSQYGNKKGTSVQHYLIKMIHQILLALDNNSRGKKNCCYSQFHRLASGI